MDEQRFSKSVQKLFSFPTTILIGFVESLETYESEPSTFSVMNARNKATGSHAIII